MTANNTLTETTVSAQNLAAFCDDYLSADAFKDYAPNGLQVDGGRPIQRIVTGVTASDALIDAAIADNADAIMVHHGYFWKGEPAPLTGMKGQRIRKLMQHGISMIGYHLPLDAHPVIGNNAKLAETLNMTITGALYPDESRPVGNIATCKPQSTQSLIAHITDALGRIPLHISAHYNASVHTESEPENNRLIQRVGICTGGAQDMIEQAALMGCDAFISGEISERTTHIARELGIDYFACGHHATERGGIQALGELIAAEFGLPVTFIDINNPV
ncbi:Nif3-like dinuclear metal center hexameric protein [Psychrobacter sp. AOP22-C1-22]|uniref:Nif3-like dinuclear metal center hexameric protein n=1 Tax=unclassified Psychrobacter TaxID=196806 RepID=UPI001787FAC1|nr:MULTISPECIES: Nif3-like dinuclear metal center hexameric protein [unclassified Psychrobacter]MBE0407975.1 Nif3-like dinuclear metal center hexameric protein [Psychrobacter sp. FME6]MBE0444834.1 Nif3-like dinuclear metal center hexameric protein [Psychrobacter sp. FME5]MDN5802811.1 Nif3-like dinuclear metal center hexameric protein [Psychrobacter sp.]MDN5891489.1 Nif3-like dinuclear metal center hexameric protein [Psychrobacter sp.]